MNTLFQRLVLSRLWLTFVVLGLSFLAFGVGTLNLGKLAGSTGTYNLSGGSLISSVLECSAL